MVTLRPVCEGVSLSTYQKNTPDWSDYEQLCAWIEVQCGNVITSEKSYFVAARLEPLMERYHIAKPSDLTRAVLWGTDAELKNAVIRAITINETHWYRDHVLWELLAGSVLPELTRSSGTNQTFRVWSAASSTGQELYSIVMLVEHLLTLGKIARRRYSFVGTDIDSDVVAAAKEGCFKSLAMKRGLTNPWTGFSKRYFDQKERGAAQVKQEFREKTSFFVYNLLNAPIDNQRCQLIFLRNVMIYFTPDVKRRVIAKMAALQRTGDVLILGNAESLYGLSDAYTVEGAGKYYRRK